MAGRYGIVLQPADCQGAIFADKWVGTAYQFYGVKECTEPAGGLDEKTFARRMFSDASCGAAQLFTYEFETHAAAIRKYIQLFTGKPGETEVAVFCPTTLYRLGASLQPTIDAGGPLRDLCEFDVLDELLIADGALTTRRYRALILFQADIVEQSILDRIKAFQRSGGKIVEVGGAPIRNVEGKLWPAANRITHVAPLSPSRDWLKDLSAQLAGCKGVDGRLDGILTSRRNGQVFMFNSTSKPVRAELGGQQVDVAPYTIWFDQLAAPAETRNKP